MRSTARVAVALLVAVGVSAGPAGSATASGPAAAGRSVGAVGRSVGAAGPPGNTWPRYGFDAYGSDNNPAADTITPANVTTLRPVWADSVGGAATTIANGMVYTDNGTSVVALDLGTGMVRWQWSPPLGWLMDSVPTEDASLVFVGGVARAGGATVVALDARSGRLRWARSFDPAGYKVASPPVVSGGTVYVTDPYYAAAIDEATGVLRWVAPAEYDHNDLVVTGGYVYLGGEILRASDGSQTYAMESAPMGGTASSGYGRFFGDVAAAGVGAWSLSCPTTGTCFPLWATSAQTYFGVAVGDGNVFVNEEAGSPGVSGTLAALDATTGATRWTAATPGSDSARPVIAGGLLFAGDGTYVDVFPVAGCGQAQCVPLWRLPTFPQPVGLPPITFFVNGVAVAGDTVVVNAPPMGVLAYRLPSAGPAVAAGQVLAGQGTDGGLWIERGRSFGPGGGELVGRPAAVDKPVGYDTPPVVAYLATGRDGHLWERSDLDLWTPLTSGGQLCTADPAVVFTGNYRDAPTPMQTVACRGPDGRLYTGQGYLYYSAPMPVATWTSLGGVISDGPAVAVLSGVFTFFGTAPDGSVWSRTATTGWVRQPWQCVGSPVVMTRGALAVFACRGSDAALWTASDDGHGWTPARSLGGRLVGSPGIAVTASGPVYYAEGTDGAAYVRTVAGGWQRLGGRFVGGVSATATN